MISNFNTGSYDSVRDYIDALDAAGHVVRISHMNQDENTAFAYRVMDKIGFKRHRLLFWNQQQLMVKNIHPRLSGMSTAR